jgi:hypothetical protein
MPFLVKLEKLTFDSKTVIVILMVAASWFDLKTDNKMRDRDIEEHEKRITKLEKKIFPDNPISAITTYNQVAILASRIERVKYKKFVNENEE